MNTIKYKNIQLNSGEWLVQKIPCVVIKHRVLKTDPIYKFVINADVYIKSSVAIRNNNGSHYYDLLNILAKSSDNSAITGTQWVSLLESKYNIVLELGDNYHSNVFPELTFTSLEDRDLLDRLYESLASSQYSDGLSVFLDFSLQPSQGFVRNKLGIDTDLIRPSLLESLSFNFISSIATQQLNGDYRVKTSFKEALSLTNYEVSYIEGLASRSSNFCPKDTNDIPYFWNYINQSSQLPLSGKQQLFGFFLEKVTISDIINTDFNMTVDNNNRPLSVTVKNGTYNSINQIINL